MRALGVIPARGGSKGIPRKNIQLLGGKPLIAHTIEAAKASRRLARFIVSTEDEEIAAAARRCGAEAPFVRPARLATDSARAIPVMQHALETMEAMENARFDALVMLQPTTPLRAAADIDGALELLEASRADSVISVVDCGGHHPARMKYLEDGRLVDPPFCEAYETQPRQELRPMYLRNGAIYAVRREILVKGSLKGGDCRAWIMPQSRSVNIDTPEDLEYARWLLEKKK